MRLGTLWPLAALAACILLEASCATTPAKLFPGFDPHTAGPVAVVGDVVVVEDVIGSTDKVYVEDCKHLGDAMLQAFESQLKLHGLAVEQRHLLSVGEVAKHDASYHVLSTWSQHKLDAEQFPVAAPPFYVGAELTDTALERQWADVVHFAWGYEKKNRTPGPQATVESGLKEKIGTSRLFVVVVAGTKIPRGKQLGQMFLSGLASNHSGKLGNSVSISSGNVDFTQFSGTIIKVAMIDTATGEVLWSDRLEEKSVLEPERIDDMVASLMKRMP